MSRTTLYIVVGLVVMLLVGAGALFFVMSKPAETENSIEVVSESIRSEALKEYFSFSDFAKPSFGGKIFVSYIKLDDYSSVEEYILYAWVYAQEYYMKDTVLTKGVGVSSPVVIHMNKEGSEVTRIEFPRNGREYGDDIQRLFPAHLIQDPLFVPTHPLHIAEIQKLISEVKEEAFVYFENREPDIQVTKNVVVDTIRGGSTVSSPLTITGKAKGWYFEGSFPVKVLDAQGKQIAIAPAQAQGDWMTTEFVPFEVTLTFTSSTKEGTIVFEKDNPSGLPEHNESLQIPVRFDVVQTEKMTVNLYYPNAVKAVEVDDVCSPATIIPITRTVPKSVTPLTDSIKLLLQGTLTTAEYDAGFMTEFPDDRFYLKNASIKDGVAILEFSEAYGFTSGGACRVGLLRNQIEKTAKQFPEVKRVIFLPENLFQP